jgi:hypothetical protein
VGTGRGVHLAVFMAPATRKIALTNSAASDDQSTAAKVSS